jgi:hypothetical protein
MPVKKKTELLSLWEDLLLMDNGKELKTEKGDRRDVTLLKKKGLIAVNKGWASLTDKRRFVKKHQTCEFA